MIDRPNESWWFHWLNRLPALRRLLTLTRVPGWWIAWAGHHLAFSLRMLITRACPGTYIWRQAPCGHGGCKNWGTTSVGCHSHHGPLTARLRDWWRIERTPTWRFSRYLEERIRENVRELDDARARRLKC